MSKELIDELQQVIGCPRDYFTLEVLPTLFILDGEEDKGRPFIQINWFERGQEVQDKVAKVINRHARSVGYEAEVFFTVLNENRYYENGEHY